MAVGETEQSTSAVMGVLEKVANKLGKGDKLKDQRWQALRKKAPNEVIPYLIACMKDEGLGGLLSQFGL